MHEPRDLVLFEITTFAIKQIKVLFLVVHVSDGFDTVGFDTGVCSRRPSVLRRI